MDEVAAGDVHVVLSQVSIYLPPLKTIKNVVDRMKNLSNFLVRITAST